MTAEQGTQGGSAGRRGRFGLRGLLGLLGMSALLGVSGLGGCFAEEVAELRGKVERLETCQQCAQTQLSQGLAIALCRPPVRQLIDDVAQVCKREDVCLDQQISTLVGDADPTHSGKFITMMDQQRHTVLYFSAKDLFIDGPEGMFTQRLRRMVQPTPPWLPATRFLVVSNLPPQPFGAGGLFGQSGSSGSSGQGKSGGRLSKTDPHVARAESRGLQIIEKILEFNFPGGPGGLGGQKVRRDMLLHWVYSFTQKRGENVAKDDLPPPGIDFSQGVWVFRIDCATPQDQLDGGPACNQCLTPAPSSSPAAAPPAAAPSPAPTAAAPRVARAGR